MSTETRPGRPAGPHTSSAPDRPTGRLRPASPHTTEVPNITKSAEAPAGAIKLSASELNTAMVHFYRGEVQRSNTWRNRLDTTTNWAVITAGATLSFAFSAPGNPHFVILINSIVVAFFLFMEARRYRYYEIWASRVRVMESGYFAQLLGPQQTIDRVWAEHLMADLTTPHFTISESEALGRRLRRNYLWLFILLALSWNLKVYLHPQPSRDMDEFIARAAVGIVPGTIVLVVGFVFNIGLIVFALATLRLREATGEVLPSHEFNLGTLGRVTGLSRVAANTRRRTSRAKQARQRVRSSSSTTGQFKRVDITESPDSQIHTTETPDRRPTGEKTLK